MEDERRTSMLNEEQVLRNFNKLNREREELIRMLEQKEE
jgi:hypothetical protein